jgi:hypothetical protein
LSVGLIPRRAAEGDDRKGYVMNSSERAHLRTRLRQVNIEYSALVRDRSEEGRFVRMTALKIQRRAIMSLLFGGELRVAVVAARESRSPRGTADQHAHTHSSSSLT